MNWSGTWVAIVTPFQSNQIDVPALQGLVDRLMDAGVNGLCPCGTTGEGSTLNDQEFTTVVETVLQKVNAQIPVVPGTGSNNTLHTVERTALAKKIGAQGALVVTPYYVKPTHDGLRRHYGMISEKTDFPMMLYNVPSRTGVNMQPETVEELAKETNTIAIKECAPLPQVAELVQRVGHKLSIFSGEDPVFLPFLALGGNGIVSVLGNIAPKNWVDVYKAFSNKDLAKAQKEFLALNDLCKLLFIESNPIPVKAALHAMGLIAKEIRSPLDWMSESAFSKLRDELRKLQLI